MEKQKTWFDGLKGKVGAFFQVRVDRWWWVIVCILALGVVCGVFLFEWAQRGGTIEDLKSENGKLKLNLRLFQTENRGLREAVAPLISQAFSEFPEEEITQSLKKIIVRLDSENALRRPITSVLAAVEIVIQTDLKIDKNHADNGGYLALCRDSDTLLLASSDSFYTRQSEEGKVKYSGVLQMSATDSAAGKPINELDEIEYLKIGFFAAPKNSIVVDGKVTIIINTSQRFEFQIPPQKMHEDMIFVREIGNFMEYQVQQKIHDEVSGDSNLSLSETYTQEEVGKIIGKYLRQTFQMEVKGPLSIERIEEESLRSVLVSFSENVRRDIPQIPFGFNNGAWLRFKMRLCGTDKIYYFMSEKASWAVLCGRAGYALIREGQVVDVIITSGN
jgi:hypothetical protein